MWVIELLVISYIVFFTLSFGISFAYIQRRYMTESDTNWKSHITLAIIWSICSPFTLPALLVATEFPRFGIKFHRGELPKKVLFFYWPNPWYGKYLSARVSREVKSQDNEEQYISLWE
jgi:hypothetical protein